MTEPSALVLALTTDLGMSLLLLRRPCPPDGMECVEDVSSLMDRLERD